MNEAETRAEYIDPKLKARTMRRVGLLKLLFERNYDSMQTMKLLEKVKNDLDQKFQRVLKTPAGFDFFVAIHDFIEHIELHASLSKILSRSIEPNPELKIPTKYGYLKQIYQGLEDADNTSDADLGHARYMVLVDLNQIRNNNFSESNSFWKKRESFRRFTREIYERLNPTLA